MFGEPFAEAWRQRFGAEAPPAIPAIERFLTHRSIRDYAPDPIPDETVAALIGAAQSAATSSNLQLWSVVSVQEPERRAALARLCGDQEHVRRAPWFLAFFADVHRLRVAACRVGEAAAGLDYAEFTIMAIIDAALAAERLVAAAETLGIGICYVGALRNDPVGVQELLGLPEGTFGAFGLCLGYPSEGSTAGIKPRFAPSAVWFRERYQEVDCEEYDRRMEPFYVGEGMKGSVTWSMRSGRRVDGNHMTGREVLKAYLEKQGLYRR